MKGGTKLSIRTASDNQDVCSFVHRGEHISLWCNGCFSRNRVSSESDSEDDSPPSSKKRKRKKRKKALALHEKNKRVEEISLQTFAKSIVHSIQLFSTGYGLRWWGTHK